jgi:triosephosphate isomerase
MKQIKIVGNWKMHKTGAQATTFVHELSEQLAKLSIAKDTKKEIALAVPYTIIQSCSSLSSNIQIGAQNMHDASSGSYTGEIALDMLLEAGAQFVILGHSERRWKFQESDDFIAKKVKRALTSEKPIHSIICVGENLEQREAGQSDQVISKQLEIALKDIESDYLKNFSIAYEPAWAVGTGVCASLENIKKAHDVIEDSLNQIKENLGSEVAILYGGSVTPDNVKEITALDGVNGVLIGGASLAVSKFSRIIELAFNQV